MNDLSKLVSKHNLLSILLQDRSIDTPIATVTLTDSGHALKDTRVDREPTTRDYDTGELVNVLQTRSTLMETLLRELKADKRGKRGVA